ncbi:MAG: tetratricopeptide repeat protein [Akkermansia sp.]
MEKQDPRPQLSEEELKAIGEIEIGPAKHEIFLNNHYKKLLLGIVIGSIGAGLAIAHFSNKQDERALAASMIVTSLAGSDSYNTSELPSIQSQYAHSPAAATAQLVDALAKLDGADAAAGLTALQTIANSATDITISSRAAAALANYYMGEGEEEKATAAWQQVANMAQNPYSALAYMSLGDMANSAGDQETARSFYTTAKEKCITSAIINAKDIDMRLMLVDVDAPKPVLSGSVSPEPVTAPTDVDTTIQLDSNIDGLPPITPTE